MKLIKTNVNRLSLPSGKSDAIVFDEALPGFGLRIRAGGKRTWVAQYRMGSKQRRVTLGSTETVDADEARRRARVVLAQAHLGTDPQAEKAAARAEAAVILGGVVKDYLERHASKRLKPSTVTEVERYLCRHWAPLADFPIRKITRSDIAGRLARIATENGDYAANRARATLSSLYGWAIAEGIADANPVVGTRRAVAEVARDRVLSDDELIRVWRLAGDGDYGLIVRLLILTGQRRDEVGAMRWSEIDRASATWRIPAGRTKNSRPHLVPFSETGLSLLSQHVGREDGDLVFGARMGSFSGWSKAKASLDARIEAEMGSQPEPWRLHDIRRTAATRMADLGVLPHVIEAILNHISGHKAGVAGVYNVSTYAVEKRAALDLWARHVAALVGTEQGHS